MNYFTIFGRNIATIFYLQWKIENISDMFLQYFLLCGFHYKSKPNYTEKQIPFKSSLEKNSSNLKQNFI